MLTSEKTKDVTSKSFVERVVFEQTIQYKPLNEIMFSGLSSNLSVGGVYLRTKLPLNVDDTLRLLFSLTFQEQEIPISCNARVAWTNLDNNQIKPDYDSGVGLQFFNLLPEDLSTLVKFIDTYDIEKRMNVICAWCGKCLGMRIGPFGETSHGICNQCRESIIV